ncbi:unnamed protein product, partial [marine sediment metagenome]
HSALDGGFLRKILVAEGGSARVNQPIAIFTESADESIEGYQPEGEAPPEAPTEPKEESNEAPKEEAPQSDNQAAPPPATGGMQEPAFTPAPPLEGTAFTETTKPIHGRIPASPLARKIAKEKGLDLTSIKGTGPHGRIMSRDLETGQPASVVSFAEKPRPTTAPGSYIEEPLTPMRKAIGKRLQESKTFIPHFYVTQEVNAQPMIATREQFKAGGMKVTFNDLVVRATALALRQHPEINSGFNTVNQTLIRFQTIDISIGVSLP